MWSRHSQRGLLPAGLVVPVVNSTRRRKHSAVGCAALSSPICLQSLLLSSVCSLPSFVPRRTCGLRSLLCAISWACSGANDPADSIWSTVTGSSGFGFIDFGRAASRHYSSSSRRLSFDGIGLVSGSIGIGARNPAARDGHRSTERFAT